MLFASFSQLCDFSGPSSKRHISGYNPCRNPKLDLRELNGNTELHTKRTIDLIKPSLRYSSSRRLRFFETLCINGTVRKFFRHRWLQEILPVNAVLSQ